MLQQFGGCGQVGPVMKALQWLVENVFLRALISCDVFHCDFPLCCSTFLSIFSNHVLVWYARLSDVYKIDALAIRVQTY